MTTVAGTTGTRVLLDVRELDVRLASLVRLAAMLPKERFEALMVEYEQLLVWIAAHPSTVL